MKVLLLTLALLGGLPLTAAAAESPKPGIVDPRIQSIDYDPDQVVVIQGAMGRQTMIEFAPGERLENVAIGDSLAWQVTPNKKADLLFIKPLDARASTNMTVVTSERRYIFELRVAPKAKAFFAPFTVRFIYPQPAVAVVVGPEPEKPPEVVNADYVMSGATANRPIRVFDDGRMTYLQWAPDAPAPAIFAVEADKSESLVNYVMRGPFVVVEQLGRTFVLRNGKQVITITNRAFSTTRVAGGEG